MLYSFAIIIVTMVGVLGKELVTGILYGFDMEVFITGILNSFETDNSKRCMNFICIGMG